MKSMGELEEFEPFDTQSLRPMEFWDFNKIMRTLNVLVDEVKQLKKQVAKQ